MGFSGQGRTRYGPGSSMVHPDLAVAAARLMGRFFLRCENPAPYSMGNQENLMRLSMTIWALALASGAFTAPATAQRAELAQRKPNVPNEAKKPIFELQTAVNANDVANI